MKDRFSHLAITASIVASIVAGAIYQDRAEDRAAQLRCREAGGVPVDRGEWGWSCRRLWREE